MTDAPSSSRTIVVTGTDTDVGKTVFAAALTAALGGFGRADASEGWGAAVFLQVIDPAAFGGLDSFLRQTTWLADAARASPPAPGVDAVRLPGARGLALRRRQLAEGVKLYPSIMPALVPWAARLQVPTPATT